MRAIRVEGPGEVSVAELPVPVPLTGEALVKVAASGVCVTDHRLVRRGANPPRVPGHEIAGWLDDRTPVGVHPDIGCGRCEQCRSGFENRCPSRISIGIDRDGGLAEYVVVPRAHVVPLGPVLMSDAPLLEPLGCCVHAVEMLDVRAGEAALVVGAGPMGLLAMWALQSRGAKVVVAQRSEPRRRLALEVGADAVVDAGEDPSSALGETPTVAVVTAPTSKALAFALDMVAVGGRVHSFAGMPEGGEIDANVVHYRHLTLTGSSGSRLDDYHRALELAGSGRIDLGRLPTRLLSTLEEARELLRAGREGEGATKTVVAVDKGV